VIVIAFVYNIYRGWPDKLYTLSYILYPFVGGAITMSVSIIVSVFTGGMLYCAFV